MTTKTTIADERDTEFARVSMIRTKFLGPTDTRWHRYKATCLGDNKATVTIDEDDTLESAQNHAAAAIALSRKLGIGDLATHRMVGSYVDGGGYVFAFVRAGGAQ